MHSADFKYLSENLKLIISLRELSTDLITKDVLPQNESEYTSQQQLSRTVPCQKLTSRWFATPSLLFAGGNGYIHMFTHTQHDG